MWITTIWFFILKTFNRNQFSLVRRAMEGETTQSSSINLFKKIQRNGTFDFELFLNNKHSIPRSHSIIMNSRRVGPAFPCLLLSFSHYTNTQPSKYIYTHVDTHENITISLTRNPQKDTIIFHGKNRDFWKQFESNFFLLPSSSFGVYIWKNFVPEIAFRPPFLIRMTAR